MFLGSRMRPLEVREPTSHFLIRQQQAGKYNRIPGTIVEVGWPGSYFQISANASHQDFPLPGAGNGM